MLNFGIKNKTIELRILTEKPKKRISLGTTKLSAIKMPATNKPKYLKAGNSFKSYLDLIRFALTWKLARFYINYIS
jgi:hypothetical protein